MKTSWKRLSSSSSEDILIKTNIFAILIRLQKTFSRRLQDVLIKTNIFVLVIRLQDVFKTSYQDVFKTSSRHLQDVLQRCLQDAFKTYHQVILFLLTSFQDVFKTYSQRFLGVLQRRLSTEGFALVTLLTNLLSVHKICKGDNSFSSFSFSLYYTF